jgi:hypothetical protein
MSVCGSWFVHIGKIVFLHIIFWGADIIKWDSYLFFSSHFELELDFLEVMILVFIRGTYIQCN